MWDEKNRPARKIIGRLKGRRDSQPRKLKKDYSKNKQEFSHPITPKTRQAENSQSTFQPALKTKDSMGSNIGSNDSGLELRNSSVYPAQLSHISHEESRPDPMASSFPFFAFSPKVGADDCFSSRLFFRPPPSSSACASLPPLRPPLLAPPLGDLIASLRLQLGLLQRPTLLGSFPLTMTPNPIATTAASKTGLFWGAATVLAPTTFQYHF
jgi:hypothetical protein